MAKEETMRCSSCGTDVRAGDAFCPECGIRVLGESPAAPAAAPPPEEATQSQETGTRAPEETAPPSPPPFAPAQRARKKTSGFAVASLVLGVCGFFVIPVIGAVLAIVFGIVAKREIKRGGGQLAGRGMATAGLVLGILGLIIPIVLAAVIVPVGLYYVWPKFEARRNLLKGVDAASSYYLEYGSYSRISTEKLAIEDGSVEFDEAPGEVPNVVYLDEIGPDSVRLYCYSRRGDRYQATAFDSHWDYNFHRTEFEKERWWKEWPSR